MTTPRRIGQVVEIRPSHDEMSTYDKIISWITYAHRWQAPNGISYELNSDSETVDLHLDAMKMEHLLRCYHYDAWQVLVWETLGDTDDIHVLPEGQPLTRHECLVRAKRAGWVHSRMNIEEFRHWLNAKLTWVENHKQQHTALIKTVDKAVKFLRKEK